MVYQPHFESSFDGKQLNTSNWPAVDSARAVVYILHGMCEHSARYADFAHFMNGRGFHVYSHDHRGHGFTVDVKDQVAHADDNDGWQLMLRDIDFRLETIRNQHPNLPIVLLGHSMGTLLALSYLRNFPVKVSSVVLSALPENLGALNTVGKMLADWQIKLLGPRSKAKLHNMLSFDTYNQNFRPVTTPFDWLSRDEDIVLKYHRDPLCGQCASAAFFRDLLNEVIEVYKPENLKKLPKDLPYLLLAGGNDPVVGKVWGFEKTLAIFKTHLHGLKSKIYHGARHEIMNETNKDEVWQDIANFFSTSVK